MKKLLIGLLALGSISAFSQSFNERSERASNGIACFMHINAESDYVADGVKYCQDLVNAKVKIDEEMSKSFSERLESLKLNETIND